MLKVLGGDLLKAVVVRNLVEKFGDFKALDGVSFEVESGKIFAFLGPNGAGKTTTVKILAGIIQKDGGDIEILGYKDPYPKDEIEIKKRIGFVPDEPEVYPYFTGSEFLSFVLDIYGNPPKMRKKMENLLSAFNIDYLGKLIMDMSHGMKQKLVLVSVLMRDPDIVLLDEPIVGLDVKSAKILKAYLRNLADSGKTVFMNTHVLEIAEKIADEIGIIDKGRMIVQGTLKELREKVGEDSSLEDLFLKLTGEEEEIRSLVEGLKE